MSIKNNYPNSYKFPLLWKNDSKQTVKMYFPDLPGCEFTVPRNFKVTEALEKATEALTSHLYQMEREQNTIPHPTPLHKLDKEPGTGIYILAAMGRYRNTFVKEKEKQPVVTQLSLLDFSSQKIPEPAKKPNPSVYLNTYKRESYKSVSADKPEKSPVLFPPTPVRSSRKARQLELWKVLIICVLVILIGGGFLSLNKNAASNKPMGLFYSQRPASNGICNLK